MTYPIAGPDLHVKKNKQGNLWREKNVTQGTFSFLHFFLGPSLRRIKQTGKRQIQSKLFPNLESDLQRAICCHVTWLFRGGGKIVQGGCKSDYFSRFTAWRGRGELICVFSIINYFRSLMVIKTPPQRKIRPSGIYLNSQEYASRGGETSPQPRSVGAPFLGPSEKGKNFFGV